MIKSHRTLLFVRSVLWLPVADWIDVKLYVVMFSIIYLFLANFRHTFCARRCNDGGIFFGLSVTSVCLSLNLLVTFYHFQMTLLLVTL